MELLVGQNFRFFVPMAERDEELVKGVRTRLIKGVASTETRDRHGEEMLLAGMDFNPYLEAGRLNWDHKEGPQYLLGRPLEAKIVSDGSIFKKGLHGPAFYNVCELYDTEPGRAAWDTMQAEKDDPNRAFGFSVQGAIMETLGRKLTKTRVDDMALTPKPANFDSFAEFAKSFTTESAGALTMQNLDDGMVTDKAQQALTGIPIEEVLWGKCEHGCYDKNTNRFAKGAQSAFYHLVKCKGMDEKRAYSLVTNLRKSGII